MKHTNKNDKIPDEIHKFQKSIAGGWNYRIIDEDGFLSLHEVFYNKKGKPTVWSVEECSPMGADLKELKHDFKLMKLAFDKPILKVKNNKLYEQK